jgi:hypothetical protein
VCKNLKKTLIQYISIFIIMIIVFSSTIALIKLKIKLTIILSIACSFPSNYSLR